MPKEKQVPISAEETPAVETTTAEETPSVETTVETAIDSGDEDGDSEDIGVMDEIFAKAVDSADLEEGDTVKDKDEKKAGEPVTTKDSDEEGAKPKDAKAQPGEEVAEKPKPEVTAEELAKEEPAVEQPTVETPKPIDPAQLTADYEKWRNDAENLLAAQHYNLSEEQAEEFDTDPGAAIPKLAARLHMEVMQQSVAMIAQMLPQIMARVNTTQTREAAVVKQFFAKWPELVEHRDHVVRLGSVYNQMNPQASLEDFIRDVGAQVAVSMQVDLSGRQTPVVETPREKPHMPLAAGGGSGAPGPVVKPGAFEELDIQAESVDADF